MPQKTRLLSMTPAKILVTANTVKTALIGSLPTGLI
jgi:hypothetical protein